MIDVHLICLVLLEHHDWSKVFSNNFSHVFFDLVHVELLDEVTFLITRQVQSAFIRDNESFIYVLYIELNNFSNLILL